jgi:hypothetical protein
VLDKIHNLCCCSQAGIDVGFRGLSTHFFGCKEKSSGNIRIQSYLYNPEQYLMIAKSFLSSNIFSNPSSSITSLRAVFTKVAPSGIFERSSKLNGLFCFRIGRNIQRNILAFPVKFFNICNTAVTPSFSISPFGYKRIISTNFHSKTFGNSGNHFPTFP